jgi:uncharacterized protein (TIGR00299 family) protein
MSILVYDPFAGISGDMNMGAMVDLGVPEEYLRTMLNALNVEGWSIEFKQELRQGITATRAVVHTDDRPAEYEHDHEHHHDHHHDAHDHEHVHHEHHHHEHRTLVDIKQILSSSDIPSSVSSRAENIFYRVAEAEAKVHGKSIDEVHFHEVGAIDSIVDIVAAAAAIEYLNPEKIISFPPQLGGGFVNCAHGRMPVPAPATAEILRDLPSRRGGVQHEATTPTGAAILAALVDEFVEDYTMKTERVGYGAGTRDTETANVLRAYLVSSAGSSADDTIMIETSIDDMNPEVFGYVCDQLHHIGAKDVWMTPVIMKKGRPGTVLSVMCTESLKPKVLDVIFTETTTAGVRSWKVDQECLDRDMVTVTTTFGPVHLKRFFKDGKIISWKAEYEDVKALAEKHGVPMNAIYRDIRYEP